MEEPKKHFSPGPDAALVLFVGSVVTIFFVVEYDFVRIT